MTRSCLMVADHNPNPHSIQVHHRWPLGMGGPAEAWNEIDACPQDHVNAHVLLRLTGYRYDGDTPWWIRRRFSTAIRDLAYDGWHLWHDAGRPVPRERWLYQGATSVLL